MSDDLAVEPDDATESTSAVFDAGGFAAPERANDDGALAALPPMPVLPAEPPAELRYRRAFDLKRNLTALGDSWHIIWGLIVRQFRAQYSQQVIGVAWEVLGPLAQMIMFTVILNNVSTASSFKTGGVPKALYLYVGLVAWSFYSSSVMTGGSSLAGNPLLNKVYAPREVFPIAQVATSGIDALISCVLFPILCVVFDHMPSVVTFYYLIPLAFLLVLFSTAITLFVSALTVYARDLRSGLPLVMQLGMLMPGIIYPVSRVHQLHSAMAHTIYTAIFPISAIAEGMRNAVFFHSGPDWSYVGVAAISICLYLAGGFLVFKKLEGGFADVS
jgi:ABC-2 type transport system permease protein/lipopolysaccharide transport system permease protein